MEKYKLLFMEAPIIYIPKLANVLLEIDYNGNKNEYFSMDGYFDLSNILPDDSATPSDPITLLYQGEEFLQLNLNEIYELHDNIKIVNATTCKEVYRDELGSLLPINATKVFSLKDKYIVIYIELEYIKYDCPINIKLFDNEMIIYAIADVLPESDFKNFHRTYAHGIEINSQYLTETMGNNVKSMTLEVSLYTGRVLFIQQVILCNQYRIISPYMNTGATKGGLNLDINF
jgi:hypothetical protein